MQHVLLFVQAVIAASDPNMSKQATACKRTHVTVMFSQKQGLKVAKATESFLTICDEKRPENQF
jgi:hypothetical protein